MRNVSELNRLTTRLDRVLSTDPAASDAANRASYDKATGNCGNRIILFGAGALGRIILEWLRGLNIEPVAFTDNNPLLWDAEIDDLEVLCPKDAVNCFKANTAFVVTVCHESPVRTQLADAECPYVASVPNLVWKHDTVCFPERGCRSASLMIDNAKEVRRAFDAWDDEESREVFVSQLEWRLTLTTECLAHVRPSQEQYFPKDLFTLTDRETFIDCGAYDGDTIRTFLAKAKQSFSRIVALEPDPENCRRLKDYVYHLPGIISSRIAVIQSALAAHQGTTWFAASGSQASAVSVEGTIEVPTISLDDMLPRVKPTYVKMDIEGAEEDGLTGGARVIGKDRPILAISAYHKYTDLWRIPLLIRDRWPEYKLFLRTYSEGWWELVCYAVPPERLVK